MIVMCACGRQPSGESREELGLSERSQSDPLLVVLHENAAAALNSALLLTVRERQIVALSDDPRTGAWLHEIDPRIKALLVAKCGRRLRGTSGPLDVLEAPIEDLIPFEVANQATAVHCTGLWVKGHYVLGRAFAGQP
jgi:hypothetical protein